MQKYNIKKRKDIVRRRMSDGLREKIDTKICDALLKDKRYRDKTYTVEMLAKDIGVSRSTVSNVIAETYNFRFSDLKNKFRVNDAIEILSLPQQKKLNIGDVALMAGFGTKMTMYKAFYKLYGLTPSEYMKKYVYQKSEGKRQEAKPGCFKGRESDFCYVDEKFADIQMLRYRLNGFDSLTRRQKAYVYHLSEATLSGRDITFDQHGKYNLLIRKTLETILRCYTGDRRQRNFKQLEIYLKRVWFSNGIHHHYSNEKFEPGFTKEFFRLALEDVDEELRQATGSGAEEVYEQIANVMFDANVMPKLVNQTDSDDVVATSSVNFYDNVTQEEAEEFYRKQRRRFDKISLGLNSRLVKDRDGLHEEVWKVDGKYGAAIEKIIYHLKKACRYVDNEKQKEVIDSLIDYYLTGDLRKFDDYSIKWLRERNGIVDFINGFIEVYDDPLGMKGMWEGLTEYVDQEATKRTQTISRNTQWFEDNSPVDKRFKRRNVTGIVSRVIRAAMLGGDEYPASAIGINLPNANWIRERYGSKSITISNLTDAYNNASRGNGFYEEFVIDSETLEMIRRYGDKCDDLHTDLHECVGHGSGKMLRNVTQEMLKTYGNTIEEARADLFGLYFIADEKLVELGLLPDKDAYKAHYYTYMMNGCLTQLVRLKDGEQIEEAHMRNRALIARWTIEHGNGAAEVTEENGKHFLRINDYEKLRGCFAVLLVEIQRIKSEGDYEAARDIVEKYGVKVDKALRNELVNRYKKLHIAPYKGFINPVLRPLLNGHGDVVDVEIDYNESYCDQMLRYSKEYGLL